MTISPEKTPPPEFKKLGSDEGISWALGFRRSLIQAEVPFLCYGGTLLGIVRDQSLIPWDDDLDFLVPRNWLLSKRFSRFHQRMVDDGFRTSLKGSPLFPSVNFYKEGYKATLSCLVRVGKLNLRPIYSVPSELLSGKDFFQSRILKAHGVEWPVPVKAESLLVHLYGEWRVPLDWNGQSHYSGAYFNSRITRVGLNLVRYVVAGSTCWSPWSQSAKKLS